MDAVREATCSERHESAVDTRKHAHVTCDTGSIVAIEMVARVGAAIATVWSRTIGTVSSRG